ARRGAGARWRRLVHRAAARRARPARSWDRQGRADLARRGLGAARRHRRPRRRGLGHRRRRQRDRPRRPQHSRRPPLPAFARGPLWFTGQRGIYGKVDPGSGAVSIWDAPRGTGPYGITATSAGVFFASLAGNYLGRIDPATGTAVALDPPTPRAGPRRA